MNNNSNMAVWFEIPVTNFERAVNFYETVFDIKIEVIDMAGFRQGLLPHDDKSMVSGAIICGQGAIPSKEGSVVYLNGDNDLNKSLSKVEMAGGEVLMTKTFLGDNIGHIAQFIDSEGNRIGIHSMS